MQIHLRWRLPKYIYTMADEKKLFKVTIDNITVEVEPGTNILMAARKIGGDVAPPAGPGSRPGRGAKRSRH